MIEALARAQHERSQETLRQLIEDKPGRVIERYFMAYEDLPQRVKDELVAEQEVKVRELLSRLGSGPAEGLARAWETIAILASGRYRVCWAKRGNERGWSWIRDGQVIGWVVAEPAVIPSVPQEVREDWRR